MPKRRGKRKANQPIETEFPDAARNADIKRRVVHDEHIQHDDIVEDMGYDLENTNEDGDDDFDAEKGEIEPSLQVSEQPDVYYKYWAQRYRLFSKYDEGIILDQEGWYSVTPELIASHIAKRIWNSLLHPSPLISHKKTQPKKQKSSLRSEKRHAGLIMDAFCGPGGNSIQFALNAPPSALVFAVDIDPNKIYMAKHNASVYGVQHRIEFIIGDSLRISPNFIDAVFLSPPWGGPEYLQSDTYELSALKPIPGVQMYQHFRNLSPNLAILLPRNTVQAQIISLASPEEAVEIEGNYLSYKIKTITAYFGGLVDRNKPSTRYRGSDKDISELNWIYEEDHEEDGE